MSKDKRIDAYIAKSEDFAKPILNHIRESVHKAVPEVEETIKWGFPHFDYNGEMMCSMASFKKHCAFTFWKASLLPDPEGILEHTERNAMGHMGRITQLKDLPDTKTLIKYIKEAARLNAEGIKVVKKPIEKEKKEVVVPDYFELALSKNKKAKAVFEKFSYSHKKEYIEWITEAKTEATRIKRMDTALEWIAEGKGRNWKYEKK